jgi:hypothetical protein
MSPSRQVGGRVRRMGKTGPVELWEEGLALMLNGQKVGSRDKLGGSRESRELGCRKTGRHCQ